LADVTVDLPIAGMTCAACSGRIERVLRRSPGVAVAEVNLATERARVVFDPAQTGPDTIVSVIRGAGYDVVAEPEPGMEAPPNPDAALGAHTARTWALTLPLLVLGMSHGALLPPAIDTWAQALLSLGIITWGAQPLLRPAWGALRHGSADMNVLVMLGATTAWGLSAANALSHPTGHHAPLWFESAGVIVATVLIGRWLEHRARRQVGDAVTALLHATPAHAQRIDVGGTTSVPVSQLRVGDRVAVAAGDAIPIDGIVRAGAVDVDERLLTGESRPIRRGIGATVHAGSVVLDGSAEVATLALGRDTAIARIAALALGAQTSKPALARFADRAAAVFTPVVLTLAAATGLVWWASGADISAALVHATTVLVVACPCALGLATPTAVLAGSSLAARAGVLITDAAALELAAAVDVVVLDKTGTLTSNTLTVASVRSALDDDAVRALVGGVQSRHPISRAVAVWAGPAAPWRDIQEVAGGGVRGVLPDGRAVALGSAGWQRREGRACDETPPGTSVDLAVGNNVVARFLLDAPLRPEAARAVRALRARGVEVAMLSGDQPEAVAETARATGIQRAEGGLQPADKLARIATLRAQGHIVMMVGDGFNDAPALAAAHVGVAMGSGADLARANATFVLLRDDLGLLDQALWIARATMRTIRWNLLWATGYNALMIPLATGLLDRWTGLRLTPMGASAAMAASSVSVVLSSLALARRPLPKDPGP
jgi:Cu+-exporting ATPase